MQIRCWLFPRSKQLFLTRSQPVLLLGRWLWFHGTPPNVASLSPMMVVRPRNRGACCSPQRVPSPLHATTHHKEMSTYKATDRKFPADQLDRSAHWTLVEWHLPEGLWHRHPQLPCSAVMKRSYGCFTNTDVKRKKERERGGEEGEKDPPGWRTGALEWCGHLPHASWLVLWMAEGYTPKLK